MARFFVTKLLDGMGFRFESEDLSAQEARAIHVLLKENDCEVEKKEQRPEKPKYDKTELDSFYGD